MYMYIVRSRDHEIVVTALRDHDEMNQLLVNKWRRMNTFQWREKHDPAFIARVQLALSFLEADTVLL